MMTGWLGTRMAIVAAAFGLDIVGRATTTR